MLAGVEGELWRETPQRFFCSLLQYSSLHLSENSLFMFLYQLFCPSHGGAVFQRGLRSRRHSINTCSLPLFPSLPPFVAASPSMISCLVISHLHVLLFLSALYLSLRRPSSFYCPARSSLSSRKLQESPATQPNLFWYTKLLAHVEFKFGSSFGYFSLNFSNSLTKYL